MWKEAILAIKNGDDPWIARNRREFIDFFRNDNEKPQGKLSKNALETHYAEKLYKIYLSCDLNGLELPLHEGALWLERASTLDGNWGWLLAIGVGGAYFADHIPARVASDYFSPREALVAGSGKPDGRAVKCGEKRWELSGSWKYCSGSEQASLFTAVTWREEKVLAVIFSQDQVCLQRDWNAIGLPLTCSHSIVVQNTGIREDHFFDLSTPPRSSNYPLASFPFMLFAQACFVPVITGISRGFWLEVQEYLANKKDIWEVFQPQRYAFIKGKYERYLEKMQELRDAFYELLEKSWKAHLAEEDRAEEELTAKGLELAHYCYETCAEIMPKLGMEVLQKDHPVQESWRNLQTAFQHGVFHVYK